LPEHARGWIPGPLGYFDNAHTTTENCAVYPPSVAIIVKIAVKACSPDTQKAHCAVIGVYEARTLPEFVQPVDGAMGGALKRRLARGDVSGRKNRTSTLHEPAGLACERLMVAGFGKRSKLELAEFRKVCRQVGQALAGSGCRDVYLWLAEVEVKHADIEQTSRHLTEALLDAWYRFDELKSDPGEDRTPKRVTLCVADKRQLRKLRADGRDAPPRARGPRREDRPRKPLPRRRKRGGDVGRDAVTTRMTRRPR